MLNLRRSSKLIDLDGMLTDHRELFKDIVVLVVGRQETRTNFITKAIEDIDSQIKEAGEVNFHHRIVRDLRIVLKESESVISGNNHSQATAVLYLHNIDDVVSAPPFRRLEIFKESFGHVDPGMVIFATMRPLDLNYDEASSEKERYLFDSFRNTTQVQAETRRFLYTNESAWDILDSVILQELCARLEQDQDKLDDYNTTLSNKKRSASEFNEMVRERREIIQMMKTKIVEPTHQSKDIPVLFKKLDDFCTRFGQIYPIAVTLDELSTFDVVIVVMGPTGSGKSNFISTVADRVGNVGITVGHNLQSCTSVVSAVKVNHPIISDVKIALVDTPGFDDTHESDVEILKRISTWLKKACKGKKHINGILYFHRINDNRMSGTALKNLGMFRKLCGDDGSQKVTFVTTMWPHSLPETQEYEAGEKQLLDEFWKECDDRETQLKEKFWMEMICNGAMVERFFNNFQSAWEILNPFVGQHLEESLEALRVIARPILIQKELVQDRESLSATSAGKELHMNIEELVKKQAILLEKMKLEVGRTSDPGVMRELVREYTEIAKKRNEAVSDMRKLEPLMKRLLGPFQSMKLTSIFKK